jgi:hypothetical protein
MKNKTIIVISFLFLLDLFFLIVFGKSYTKLVLFPPVFYIHDVILLLLAVTGIWFIKNENRIISVEMVFLIAILYLIISFFRIDFDLDRSYLLIRQFMLFGYGLLVYIIVASLLGEIFIKKNGTKIIMCFGLICVAFQVVYIVYLFSIGCSKGLSERNYFSPIIMMGLFVTASYALVNIESKSLKNCLFFLIFLVSFSTGHDSTYLSLTLIYFSYMFVISSKKYKLMLSILFLAGIIMFFIFLPSFSDVNAQWRLIYWKDSLLKIANNYFVFGDGFGIQYASDVTISKLNDLYPDTPNSPRIKGVAKYVTAPHNSFLSMAIHIGILSIILLFYPIKNIFYDKYLIMDKEILFLALSLLGIVVFSSFNVILELPHSSSIFWIVFISLIFKLSDKRESSSNNREL